MLSEGDRRRLTELARVAEAMRPAIEAATAVGRSFQAAGLPELYERASELASAAQEAYRVSLPANWEGFAVKEFGAAVDLMLERGINVAWVPRAEVVRAL